MVIPCSLWIFMVPILVLEGGGEYTADSRQELTVKTADLKSCKSYGNLCVLDERNCVTVTPVAQEAVENISCIYPQPGDYFSCSWSSVNGSKGEVTYSFIIFRSETIYHCPTIFSLKANFNVVITARDHSEKIKLLSSPHAVSLSEIEKPPKPTNMSLLATDTTITVKWTSKFVNDLCCKVFYKLITKQQWTEVSGLVPVVQGKTGVCTIEELLPFSNYKVKVSCIRENNQGLWTDPTEKQVETLESTPSKPLDVCYRIEVWRAKGLHTLMLTLMWKALEDVDSHGLVLGYQVHYKPRDNSSQGETVNTTDLKTSLVVTGGDYEVMVLAYNRAGVSPVKRLTVTSSCYTGLPAVKGVWVDVRGDAIMVLWDRAVSPVPVSEFAIEWSVDRDDALSYWQRADNTTSNVTLHGHFQPLITYNFTVYPIYEEVCGPPHSVQATLEKGVLIDIKEWNIVDVKKYTATLQLMRQRKLLGNSFLKYRVTLRSEGETRYFLFSSDEQQKIFSDLKPNTKYSVSLMAGNSTEETFVFTTLLFETTEVTSAVISIALLTLLAGLFFILFRTLFKVNIFPRIPNPSISLIGRWLLESEQEKTGWVLELQDPLPATLHPEGPKKVGRATT